MSDKKGKITMERYKSGHRAYGDFTHVQFNFSDDFCVVHCYGASIVIFTIKFSSCRKALSSEIFRDVGYFTKMDVF